MPGVPIYTYPMYPSDVAKLHKEMDKFFNFGPTGVIDFEELVCRLLVSTTLVSMLT